MLLAESQDQTPRFSTWVLCGGGGGGGGGGGHTEIPHLVVLNTRVW